MNFELYLSKGEFNIPECLTCMKIVWPPMEFCNQCFGTVTLKKGNFEGRVIEFSKYEEKWFCIVEFENTIRIMAKISKIPEKGQKVKISKCGISNGDYFFYVE